MGYEVLDAGGGDLDLPTSPFPRSDVVPIDDLLEPAAQLDAIPRQPGPRPGQRQASRDGTGLGRQAQVVGIVAALLVGTVLGGAWARRHAAQQEAAARADAVEVVAFITAVDSVLGGPYADLTVRLVNSGPLPVQLVTTAYGALPTQGRPVVRPLGGASTISSGGELSANVRVAVDCTGRSTPSAVIRVPIRTANGAVHPVTATDAGAIANIPPGNAPCSASDGPSLEVQVAGTLRRPTLQLINTTNRALVVDLDITRSPFVAQSTNFSVLHLTPALPKLILPQERLVLNVLLTPWACPEGLSIVLNSQVSPYIVLTAGAIGATELAQEPIGVDLSTLWGAALARNCW